MKEIIFNNVKDTLRASAPCVKTVSVYMKQNFNESLAKTFQTPAVFIGFEDFEYIQESRTSFDGTGTVVLTIITRYLSGEPFSAYRVENEIKQSMSNAGSFGTMVLESSTSDEDENNTYVNTLRYHITWSEYITTEEEEFEIIVGENSTSGVSLTLDLKQDVNDNIYTGHFNKKI